MQSVVKVKIPADACGKPLSLWLRDNTDIFIPHPCGGRGQCGGCKVRVLSGRFLLPDNSIYYPDADGFIRACRALCGDGGAQIEVITHAHADGAKVRGRGKNIAVAVDIGTTTVDVAIVSRDTKDILARQSFLNPQAVYGADVMSRISAALDGHLGDMRTVLLCDLEKCVSGLLSACGASNAKFEMYVVGNPTMLHIFAGKSVEGLAKYPFSSPLLGGAEMRRGELEREGIFGLLDIKKITVLPSIAPFVGADTAAAMYVSGMVGMEKPSLLVDLGTNGEIVLWDGEELTVTSVAAGPAFEGADIKCGVGGVAGAVSSVRRSGGELDFSTVADAEPIGICGSGLVDLAAVLLDMGVIEKNGAMNVQKFVLCNDIYLCGEDVRNLQLAKSAVRAGIEVLLENAHLKWGDLGKIYIAGGLGSYINFENALRIGLFSSEFCGETVPLGNAALFGAVASSGEDNALSEIQKTAKNARHTELSLSGEFSENFISYMGF